MMTELLPCPFCGGEAVPDYCSGPDGPVYFFHCQSKDCPAWPNVQGETEIEAIAAWNTRPQPAEAPASEWATAMSAATRWNASPAFSAPPSASASPMRS